MRLKVFLHLMLVLLTTGCTRVINYEHDKYANLDKDVYDELLDFVPTPLPPEATKVVEKPALDPAFNKKISFIAQPGTDISHMLVETAQRLGLNISVEEKLVSPHFLQFKNITFLNLLDELTEVANLAYSAQDARVRAWGDKPYVQHYNLPFLSIDRKSKSSTMLATKMHSNGTGNTNHQMVNGSESEINAETNNNFFKEITENLKSILQQGKEKHHFTLNAQSGVINVNAPQKQQRQVAQYLQNIKKAMATQVVIEAKIMEVSLRDEYKSGINWNFVFNKTFNGSLNLGNGTTVNDPSKLAFSLQRDNLSSFLNLIQRFGTGRTLSSPRLTVLNNQPSLMKITQNYVYFTVSSDTIITKDGLLGEQTPINTMKSEVKTVPVGLMMAVHPSIDLDTNEVTLTVRPTLTSITGKVSDPAVRIAAAKTDHPDISSEIPIVEVREMESVMRLKSGQVMVMGGLMQEKVHNKSGGLPGFTQGPLGSLFGDKDDNREVVELVMFIKVDIKSPTDTNTTQADHRLYQKFAKDPRPF